MVVLEHLALAFQATCRLWQTSFTYLQGDTSSIPKYWISKDDCISTLPDDILYSIVSLLTVRDVVKASMLSRRWRDLCVSLPNLNFDLHTVFGEPSVIQVWNNETIMHRCPKYRREFVKILNQLLNFYLGPKISYFRISFCLGREYSRLIDKWVRLAVTLDVVKLELNFVCIEEYASLEDNYNNLYTLSLQILSEASKLKHLHLYACNLKPDLTARFNSLTNLYLYSVPLSQIDLEMVLRSCSNLEWLTIRECILPVKLCICDLFNLKFFALRRCEGLRNLELSATNLTTFEISDSVVMKISFSNVPKLEKVFFSLMCQNAMPYIFGEVAKVLPQLKSLSILAYIKWVENIPANPTVFSNIKQLELFMIQDRQYDPAKIIAPLLSALPLLQKLYVVMPYPKSFEERSEERSVEETLSYPHTQLKEVEIGGFCGTWNQIDFAIYLLKNAVGLDKMVIEARFRIYLGSGCWRHSHTPLWSKEKRRFIYDLLVDKIFSKKTQVIIR